MAPAVDVAHLSVAYGSQPVLWDVSFCLEQGTLLGIVGPNGAGKTTLIKTVLGLIRPLAGSVRVFGEYYNPRQHRIAYVPQRASVDWDFPVSVLDVVLMGRYAHIGWFWRPGKKDVAAAYDALARVGMQHYAHTRISDLSGGQQQRVFLARALAQDASLYLMDEPFIGVDHATELASIALFKELRAEGKTIVVVHHNLQDLTTYFDWVLLLNVERIAYGPVHEVVMPEYVCAAYGQHTMTKLRS